MSKSLWKWCSIKKKISFCSPCVSKPIKQRVEAFEKLQTPQKDTRKARVDTDVSCMDGSVLFNIHFIVCTNCYVFWFGREQEYKQVVRK